jgi:ribosome biogenesis GTPase
MNEERYAALTEIGWKPVFQQQLMAYPEHLQPARVVVVQRTGLTIAPPVNGFDEVVIGGRFYQQEVEARPTVGDWVLVDPETGALEDVLERTSLIKRLSPAGEVQLIAANIDTAFIVTSCNDDFNLARLERYLSVVMEAEIQPVVVLTKIDLTETPDDYLDEARTLGADIPIEAVNALDEESLAGLVGWCGAGQSIALLGSSGVGKSTLVNTLCGTQLQATQTIREDDAKGRHTTTHRSLHKLPQGGVILDSPGMREFQLADAEQGVGTVFADIEELAMGCRFNDCAHGGEPGCAVRAAIEAGRLDERRLESYLKLQREEQYNRETVAERHARARQFSRHVKNSLASSHKKRDS